MSTHLNWDYSDPPNHDEFALQELGESLQEAAINKRPTTLIVYRIGALTGIIEKLDATTRKIHIQTEDQGLFKIPFLEIWGAEDPA